MDTWKLEDNIEAFFNEHTVVIWLWLKERNDSQK